MISIIENLEHLQEDLQKRIQAKFGTILLSKRRVFLKPNMGYPKPAPYTTSIEVIKKVVAIVTEFGAEEIIIGEGSTSRSSALENFKVTGLVQALKKFNVSFIDLDKLDSVAVKVREGVTHFLPIILREMDLRISLPVIKFYDDDEGEPFLSNAIKNFFGLPPKAKYRTFNSSHMRDGLHKNLHQAVADVFLAVQRFAPFDLYVCDGTKMLWGFAERGEPKEWGKVIVSDNAITADLEVLKMMNKPLPKFLRILTE